MEELKPPAWANKLLRMFLRDELAEEVQGDLEEKFYVDVKSKSVFRAKLNYWFQVFNYMRPFAFRKKKSTQLNQYDMFQNYFKIASRNLLKQKLYSGINIAGLALGLTCFMVILLYVQHEFSYDRFYPNVQRIYRVYQKQAGNEFMGTDYFAVTPAQLARVMMEECPEVAHATSVQRTSGLLSHNDANFWQEGIAADAEFFNVFRVSFNEGNPQTALQDGRSIVLTQTLAQTVFGDQDPIGKAFRYQDVAEDFIVTGIIPDPPANASFKYSFVIHLLYSSGYAEEIKRMGWSNNSYYTFFELREAATVSDLENRFVSLLKKYQLPEDYADYPFKDQYFAQSLTDSYFQTGINFDLGQKGNLKVIYAYAAVALIVLLLACVNYMNLAVARSVKRAREVGLRKVVGAVRTQLVAQFLGESILIALFALLLAIGLTYSVLPYFAQIVERPVEFNLLANPWVVPALLVLVLVVGLLSGSYPAFAMSSLKPIDVLKTKSDVKISGFSLQQFLMVFQFVVSTVLIFSSVVIYRQLNFMKNKELGYNKEDVVTIWIRDRALRDKLDVLAQGWQQHPGVLNATMTTSLPADISSSTLIKKAPADKDQMAIYQWSVGNDFQNVFGMELVAGRTFSKAINSDLLQENFIINETAARALGWTAEEAIGKQFEYNDAPRSVIGVVKDFHMLSMHLPIQPLMIRYSEEWGRFFAIKIKPTEINETLSHIEDVFKKNSIYPFEYRFLSDEYNKLYSSELKLGEVFGFFTITSIVIASLGLFGLAAFTTSQRTKEIGIRKVLGASVQQVVVILSQSFAWRVLAAFIIAVPLGWFAMNSWLQDFAYRIQLTWWMFALAGLSAFMVAGISIGYLSIRASQANPVDSLRSE
ncbi:MAG: ABC transporter permease [Cyclobacteriaceae bacterium]|nr:ABC transporter permease [Cyclobacteriaceae bacterium]